MNLEININGVRLCRFYYISNSDIPLGQDDLIDI